MEASASEDKAWQKVLWKRQPFPDDYIPPSFLSSLRRNTNVRSYAYPPLVLSACAVTQHLSTIFIFTAVFIRLNLGSNTADTHRLDPRTLTWFSITLFPIGYAVWEMLEPRKAPLEPHKRTRVRAMKSPVLVFMILLVTSPVLKNLSRATSSDSIWAMASMLFCLNAILADYTAASPFTRKERLTSVLSMNAAISSSVVLASRLNSDLSVFGLVLLSVEIFALFPLLRRRIQFKAPPLIKAIITGLLASLAIYPFIDTYFTAALLIGGLLTFVTFVCPALFIWAQQYKNEIKGPWDPAVPHIR